MCGAFQPEVDDLLTKLGESMDRTIAQTDRAIDAEYALATLSQQRDEAVRLLRKVLNYCPRCNSPNPKECRAPFHMQFRAFLSRLDTPEEPE